MSPCEVCGNDYDRSFQVIAGGTSHTFDSIECDSSAIAPHCEHCDCRILGHGLEENGHFFCCAHCAKSFGQTKLRDRA